MGSVRCILAAMRRKPKKDPVRVAGVRGNGERSGLLSLGTVGGVARHFEERLVEALRLFEKREVGTVVEPDQVFRRGIQALVIAFRAGEGRPIILATGEEIGGDGEFRNAAN